MGWYSSRGGLERDVPLKKEVMKNDGGSQTKQTPKKNDTFIDLRKSKKKMRRCSK